MPPYKYHAFISYSRANAAWSKWLHRALERYRVPAQFSRRGSKRGSISPIFRDREELASSADLSERINGALAASESLIVVCSPQARESRWVDQEIRTFKELGRSDRIFCFIVDGEPSSTDAGEDCFPPSLRVLYGADGTCLDKPVEPIAADARKEGDGRSLAFLKIVAGLLDVGLDDLRQRDTRRRQRRLVAVTAGSLAGLVVTSMLALYAWMASSEADRRRQQAEDLLGYMVGDLRTSLTPIGRLDLLEGVGTRAMQYFATVPVENLSVGELLLQSQVLTQVGQIKLDQLNYEEALASFEEAYERSSALQVKDPDDGDRLYNRGQAEFWVGFVHWRNGSLEEAEEWLSRYRDTSEALLELDESRDDWVREVGYAYHNLAVLAVELGDLEGAKEGFSFLVTILESLKARDDDPQLHRELAEVISWMGNVSLSQGNMVGAMEYYQSSADELRLVWERNPDDATSQMFLAYAVSRVARLESMMGQLEDANQLVGEAIGLYDALITRDPSNTKWLGASMIPRRVKAGLLVRQQNWVHAESLVDEALVTLEKLIGDGTNNLEVNELLADFSLMSARIARTSGDSHQAIQHARAAENHMQDFIRLGRLDEERLALLASIQVIEAELLTLLDSVEQADQKLEQLKSLLKVPATTTSSPLILDPWARLLFLTGRGDEARGVREWLTNMGYVPIDPWPW